jgi:hypothetical protein
MEAYYIFIIALIFLVLIIVHCGKNLIKMPRKVEYVAWKWKMWRYYLRQHLGHLLSTPPMQHLYKLCRWNNEVHWFSLLYLHNAIARAVILVFFPELFVSELRDSTVLQIGSHSATFFHFQLNYFHHRMVFTHGESNSSLSYKLNLTNEKFAVSGFMRSGYIF